MASDKAMAELVTRLDRIEAAIASRIPSIMDPPPDDIGRIGIWWRPIPFPIPVPGPNPGDPGPMDISRLSRAQLHVSLESIKAHRIRLDAMENLIQEQLKQTNG